MGNITVTGKEAILASLALFFGGVISMIAGDQISPACRLILIAIVSILSGIGLYYIPRITIRITKRRKISEVKKINKSLEIRKDISSSSDIRLFIKYAESVDDYKVMSIGSIHYDSTKSEKWDGTLNYFPPAAIELYSEKSFEFIKVYPKYFIVATNQGDEKYQVQFTQNDYIFIVRIDYGFDGNGYGGFRIFKIPVSFRPGSSVVIGEPIAADPPPEKMIL